MEEEIIVKLQYAEYLVKVGDMHYSFITNVQINKITNELVIFEIDNKILNTKLGIDWNSNDNKYFIKFQSYKMD